MKLKLVVFALLIFTLTVGGCRRAKMVASTDLSGYIGGGSAFQSKIVLADSPVQVAQKKILANETEKVLVQIAFAVEPGTSSRKGFWLIWGAIRESGDVLADSTASLITTIVAIIPWLILIIPGMWFLVRVWRKIKLRHKPPSAT